MWITKSLHSQVTQAFLHSSCDALAVLAPFYPVCLASLYCSCFQVNYNTYCFIYFQCDFGTTSEVPETSDWDNFEDNRYTAHMNLILFVIWRFLVCVACFAYEVCCVADYVCC
jgi:hypothetical protein